MIIKLNWKTGLAVTAIAVVTAYIGYMIGQPEFCCAYPGNKDWLDYLTAFAGPIAIAIAIASITYSEIVRNADRRNAKLEHDAFCKNIKANMIKELEIIFNSASYITVELQNSHEDSKAILFPNEAVTPVRPIFEAMTDRLYELPNDVISAVCEKEGEYRLVQHRYTEVLKKDAEIGCQAQEVFRVAVDLFFSTGSYLCALKRDPNTKIKPSFDEIVRDAGARPDWTSLR